MKIGLCSFSGYKIYPGHGKRMVKTDGKTFHFLNAKCEASHMMKRNPRKGDVDGAVSPQAQEGPGGGDGQAAHQSARPKFQRAIVGASLNDIMARRNMKPEVRKAQREQAIRAAKEKQRAQKAQKKTTATPLAKVAQKQKASKPIQMKAPRVGGKR
uniref:Large ribosomal subunit protein eL24 n=1 Tax=Ixodes ricinus TaxID=34613 RepID=A0A090XDV9_IXORI